MGHRKDPGEIVTKVIYRLRNPLNEKIFYVGYAAGDGSYRFKCHTGPQCHSWLLIEYIYNLGVSGYDPLFEVVDRITGTLAQVLALETKWIHAMEAIYGEEMCNVSSSSLKKRRRVSVETRKALIIALGWNRKPERPVSNQSDARRFAKWMDEQLNPKPKPEKKKTGRSKWKEGDKLSEKYSQCCCAEERKVWRERQAIRKYTRCYWLQ